LLIPFLAQSLNYPKTTTKFFFVLATFSISILFTKLLHLKLNWVGFPGKEFLGWINLFGVVSQNRRAFILDDPFLYFQILSLFEYFDNG